MPHRPLPACAKVLARPNAMSRLPDWQAGQMWRNHAYGWAGRCDADAFTPAAELADRLAERELNTIPTDAPRDQTVEAVVVGTAVFGSALMALRRLAQAHYSARRFGERRSPRRSPKVTADRQSRDGRRRQGAGEMQPVQGTQPGSCAWPRSCPTCLLLRTSAMTD
jgi:hypothetical protein